jgi:hypothetical protein
MSASQVRTINSPILNNDNSSDSDSDEGNSDDDHRKVQVAVDRHGVPLVIKSRDTLDSDSDSGSDSGSDSSDDVDDVRQSMDVGDILLRIQ